MNGSRHLATRLAWSLWALVVGFVVGSAVLAFLSRSVLDASSLTSEVIFCLSAMSFGTAGVFIARRHPRNPIGWLFLMMAFGFAGGVFAEEYAVRGLITAPGSLPAVRWIAFPVNYLWFLSFGLFALIFLLFPTGRAASPFWRAVTQGTSVLLSVGFVGSILADETTSGDRLLDRLGIRISNPLGVHALSAGGNVAATVVPVGFLVAGFGAVASLIQRWRQSDGDERQQIKWLAVVGGSALASVLLLIVVVATRSQFLEAPFFFTTSGLLCLGIPAASGIAILKYRVFDLDVVIKKTVVVGVLIGFVTLAYVAVVVGIGTAVGNRGNGTLTLLTTVVVALAFQPVRLQARHLSNRIVYGKRASPYETLATLSQGLAGSESTPDVLVRVARLVVEATGAMSATVWVRLGETLQPEAAWPPRETSPEPIQVVEPGLEETLRSAHSGAQVFRVEHEAELLGALVVQVSPSEPLTPTGENLIESLARQTGLGLSFERMKERALFARALASFLPPEVAEMVQASPSSLSLREEVEATILFSDIRGFSSLAEQLSPSEVADLVGRHLSAMAGVVASHGGTLDKFAGDAVMAVFGVPRRSPDHPARALRCAVAMQQRQAELNAEAQTLGIPTSQIGIGVNTGTVIAGTIGGLGRLDYTVLGDAVNVAQRLQSEAAGGEILVSAATIHQAGASDVEAAGFRRLKGRQEPVEVFRLPWGAPAMD
jgi:class 3 adenylate cyclase